MADDIPPDYLAQAPPMLALGVENTNDVFWYRPRLARTAFDADLADDHVVIRYLTDAKFERFVRASALYMRRHDLLRTIDEREGSVSPLNEAMDRVMRHDEAQQRRLSRQQYEDVWLKQAFVACFSLEDVESEYHYNQYIGEENGVAVFSTVGHLRELCVGDGGQGRIKDAVIAPIRYIDFNAQAMDELEFDYPAFFKHERWRQDCELRFMVRYRTGIMHGPHGVYHDTWPRGEYRPGNLDRFIARIAVAPQSRRGYIDDVRRLLEQNGVQAAAAPSELPWRDRP